MDDVYSFTCIIVYVECEGEIYIHVKKFKYGFKFNKITAVKNHFFEQKKY